VLGITFQNKLKNAAAGLSIYLGPRVNLGDIIEIDNIQTTTTILCDPVSSLNFTRSMSLTIAMIATVITMEITAKTICDIRNRILLFDQ
jgi:hypothetical protein